MTLQEAKDQVAKTYGKAAGVKYASWDDMVDSIKNTIGGRGALLSRLEEAAALWCLEERRRTWDEACEAMKRDCENAFTLQANQNKIYYVPKPEFKP